MPSAWVKWWCDVAQHAEPEHKFPARNLLLDDNIAAPRARAYADCFQSIPDPFWPVDALPYNFPPHKKYVTDRLWKNHSGVLPTILEPSDFTCPETFMNIPATSPFLDANLDLRLVRVEGASGMAARVGVDSGELMRLAGAASSGDAAAADAMDLYFEALAEKSAVRPEFATFLADVLPVFSEPDWEDRLRDTLGLIHHDPAPGNEIPILVFSYPLKDLPYVQGHPATRPLVPPIVLESGWNSAFCPSPAGGRSGHTIDLAGATTAPRREVLHPTIQYHARHIYRVGNIRRPVEKGNLEIARSLHLTEIRKMYGRPDYAQATDSDIA